MASRTPLDVQGHETFLPVEDAPADDFDLAQLPQTDLGNAERFARRFKQKFLHNSALGWLDWDGTRWRREDADNAVSLAVHRTVRLIQVEAKVLRESDEDHVVETKRDGRIIRRSDRLAGWGRASEASPKMSAIPKHGAPYLAVATDDLDSDPWKINVANGTLVVRRDAGDEDPIAFRPHDPHDRITKRSPVFYDPHASCPIYDRFLDQVQHDPQMRAFLHRWFGYSLTGDTSEQKLVFFYGKGKNGKSTLVDVWGHVAGDYGEISPIETFLDQGKGRNAGAATPDVAILQSVRMLRTSEPEKNAKLGESFIKLVTGGEPIQARHLNKDYFRFRPAFKLTMQGNYRPQISGTDEGIWRRVVLVPWLVTVDKPDGDLPAKLAAEASGILNRALDGLRSYLEDGLKLPEPVTDATAKYRADSDPLGRFLAEAVVGEVGAREQSSTFHRVFVAWAKASGEREWSPKGLGNAMKERGYQSIRSDGMWWIDIRLRLHEADFSSASPHPSQGADDDE
ncbi:phage/plasmid primase, P4 family [Mesorhizobium sp. M0913]|uniref:DNA primase family protein n=1 Tax=Mesorhizobium sp. M0913 TaxID=2957026 RepID=UPI00333A970C